MINNLNILESRIGGALYLSYMIEECGIPYLGEYYYERLYNTDG